jgi:hypothetical protein
MSRARAFSPLLATFALLAACNNDGGGSATAADDTTGGPTGAPTTDAPMSTTDTPTTTGDTPSSTTDAPSTTTGVDPMLCGNGVLDPGETCDGVDLGDKACVDVGPNYVGGTLACAGDCNSFDASGCELAPGVGVAALNEVGAAGALDGPYLEKGDIIEIYNAGDAALDLSGYKLAQDPTFPADKTFVFPDGTQLAPGEWMVLLELDEDTLEGHFPFKLSQDKDETVVLADAGGVTVDSLTFAGYLAKRSYCRVPDGQGAWEQCEQTFGALNVKSLIACGDGKAEGDEACDGDDLAGATCMSLGFGGGGELGCNADCTHDMAACSTGSALVINELESTADDIELYNSSDKPIDVSGWIMTDDVVDMAYDPAADLEKVVFAMGTTVPAKGFFVVHKGEDPNYHPFGLSSDGETVSLLKPDKSLVDKVTFGAMQADISFCRMPDGPTGAWTPMCTPTIDLPNKAN